MRTEPTPQIGQEGPQIVCAHCGHGNPDGFHRCLRCGRQLYIVCGYCGARNLRSRQRCSKCASSLQRPSKPAEHSQASAAGLPHEPSTEPASARQEQAAVLCAKCGCLNPANGETCVRCHHQLYVYCHCGARNLRSRPDCERCGQRLRSRHDHGSRPLLGSSTFGPSKAPPRQNQLALAVLIFGLLAGIPFLMWVVRRQQRYWSEELVWGQVTSAPLVDPYLSKLAVFVILGIGFLVWLASLGRKR